MTEAKHITRTYKGIEVKSYLGNHGKQHHMFTLPNGNSHSLGDYKGAKKRINKYLKELN
jgi:hypothetical protein